MSARPRRKSRLIYRPTHKELVEIEEQIQEATVKHNEFLKELGLSPLPPLNQ